MREILWLFRCGGRERYNSKGVVLWMQQLTLLSRKLA